MNEEEIKKWMAENLVIKNEASKYTNQTDKAFTQSVQNGNIKPFFEQGSGRSMVRLFLIKDLEAYGAQVATRRERLNMPKNEENPR
ncbi:hypothetical protein HCJ39_07200 [Listeria rocourtiae]|uniref:hypothetical protein n=1 Tax=Listeria rocourtiae TaxID=647910 RepID=UPI001627B457|nr:hypothetical protein [Listeria rocourtiae]MBC1604497.1 hypothetical protein [Listeria rocourtiae]